MSIVTEHSVWHMVGSWWMWDEWRTIYKGDHSQQAGIFSCSESPPLFTFPTPTPQKPFVLSVSLWWTRLPSCSGGSSLFLCSRSHPSFSRTTLLSVNFHFPSSFSPVFLTSLCPSQWKDQSYAWKTLNKCLQKKWKQVFSLRKDLLKDSLQLCVPLVQWISKFPDVKSFAQMYFYLKILFVTCEKPTVLVGRENAGRENAGLRLCNVTLCLSPLWWWRVHVVYWAYSGHVKGAAQVMLVVKNPPANAGDVRDGIQSLGQEEPLEGSMATHSSILAWRIP